MVKTIIFLALISGVVQAAPTPVQDLMLFQVNKQSSTTKPDYQKLRKEVFLRSKESFDQKRHAELFNLDGTPKGYDPNGYNSP